MYDIIIPNWNQSGFAIKLLESIKKHSSSEDYRVIFVDNGSEEEEFNKIYEVLRLIPHQLIRNKENMGFVKAVNQGLAYSTAPYVVIQNNDTEVVPQWLEKLQQALEQDPSIGMSGPRTNTPRSWQGEWTKTVGTKILSKSAMLAFFCVMFKREMLEDVGYLDEDYGVGFADDDDYCDRAKKKGWKLVLVQDLMVPHYHNATFEQIYSQDEINDMKKKAIKMFREKSGQKHSGSPNLDEHFRRLKKRPQEVHKKRFYYKIDCSEPFEDAFQKISGDAKINSITQEQYESGKG